MEKRNRKALAWSKLDNTAILFPVIASSQMSSVYRESVLLTEDIDGELLKKAQDAVLEQFITFRMRLKMGFFWYYFEENDRKFPEVHEESDFPGAYINKSRNNYYLFRLTYYKKRINLEVFHALTDGYGGLVFLKEIVYEYLRLRYPEEYKDEKHKLSPGVFMDQEDSYIKNYRKAASLDRAYTPTKAVIIKGEKVPAGELNVIHGYLKVPELKTLCKELDVTINQLLVGVYVYSIYKEYLKGMSSKLPICCCIPADLRARYESTTMKNFFVVTQARFTPEDREYTPEEVIKLVAEAHKKEVEPDNLDAILSYNVSNEQNIFLRPIPIFIKNIAIYSVYHATSTTATTTMTNVGKVEVREPYKKYIQHFYGMLSMSKGQNIKGAICTYNDTAVVTFSSCLTDVSIQKRFFQYLASKGLNVMIENNEAEEVTDKGDTDGTLSEV